MRRFLLVLPLLVFVVVAGRTRTPPPDCDYLQAQGPVVPMVCGVSEPADSPERIQQAIETLKQEVGACLDSLDLENDPARLDGVKFRWANEILMLPTVPGLLVGLDDPFEHVIYVRTWLPTPWTVQDVLRHEAIHVLLDESHGRGHEYAYATCANPEWNG